jgi:hypothetical protein
LNEIEESEMPRILFRLEGVGVLVGILLFSCPGFTQPSGLSDAEWRRAIAGTWIEAHAMGLEEESFHPDGSYVSSARLPLAGRELDFQAKGTWKIENGLLTIVTTETSQPKLHPPGKETRVRLLSTDGHRLVSFFEDKKEKAIHCRKLEADHQKLIEKFIDSVDAGLIQSALDFQQRQITDQLKGLAYPGKNEQNDQILIDKVVAFLQDSTRPESFRDYYIYLYGSTYSKREVQAMYDFYNSEVGRSIKEKQPEIIERSMADTNKCMALITPGVRMLIRVHRLSPSILP